MHLRTSKSTCTTQPVHVILRYTPFIMSKQWNLEIN